MRDATKRTTARDRSNYIIFSKRDDQQLSAAGPEMFSEESGIAENLNCELLGDMVKHPFPFTICRYKALSYVSVICMDSG